MNIIMKYVSILSVPDLETLKEALAHHSNNSARPKAHAQLTLKTGKKFSQQCLASALKKLNFTYKQCRRALKQQRVQACFLQSRIQLTQLQADK